MRRRLFNIAAAVSLGLCLAATTFAIRGIWRSDWVSYGGNTWTAMAASIGSSAWITFWFDSDGRNRGFAAESEPLHRPYFSELPADEMNWLGFSAFTGRTDASTISPFGGARPYGTVVIPHWMLAAAAAVFPVLWVTRKYRGRLGPGRCRRCGYDLRASPDRCPECGTTTAEATA